MVAGCLLAVALAGSGCTTLQSTQLPPDELREGIRNGSLAQPGGKISVVTAAGREYVLTVGDVGEDAIRGELSNGEEVAVAIDDLVALRTHRVEPVRTTYAVLGGSFAVGFGLILVLGALLSI